MSEKKKWSDIGSIREGNSGKLYIKLDKVDELYDGVALQIEKPEEEINRLYELGFVNDEQKEERLSKLPSWLKYKIKLAPKKD